MKLPTTRNGRGLTLKLALIGPFSKAETLAPTLGVEFVLFDHVRRDQVQNHVQQPGFELSIVIGVNGGDNLCQMAARKCTSRVKRKGL